MVRHGLISRKSPEVNVIDRNRYGALLNGPLENQQRSHLPSMPEDELSMIIRATTRGNEACV